jgi:hypothetical protein
MIPGTIRLTHEEIEQQRDEILRALSNAVPDDSAAVAVLMAVLDMVEHLLLHQGIQEPAMAIYGEFNLWLAKELQEGRGREQRTLQ